MINIPNFNNKFSTLGSRIFPYKKVDDLPPAVEPDLFSTVRCKDIQTAFGILAHAIQEARDSEDEAHRALEKRDEEVLAEYKEEVLPKLKNSIYIMSDKERAAHEKFFGEHAKKHDLLGERIYHISETALGPILVLECPTCHETLDITDTSMW